MNNRYYYYNFDTRMTDFDGEKLEKDMSVLPVINQDTQYSAKTLRDTISYLNEIFGSQEFALLHIPQVTVLMKRLSERIDGVVRNDDVQVEFNRAMVAMKCEDLLREKGVDESDAMSLRWLLEVMLADIRMRVFASQFHSLDNLEEYWNGLKLQLFSKSKYESAKAFIPSYYEDSGRVFSSNTMKYVDKILRNNTLE